MGWYWLWESTQKISLGVMSLPEKGRKRRGKGMCGVMLKTCGRWDWNDRKRMPTPLISSLHSAVTVPFTMPKLTIQLPFTIILSINTLIVNMSQLLHPRVYLVIALTGSIRNGSLLRPISAWHLLVDLLVVLFGYLAIWLSEPFSMVGSGRYLNYSP